MTEPFFFGYQGLSLLRKPYAYANLHPNWGFSLGNLGHALGNMRTTRMTPSVPAIMRTVLNVFWCDPSGFRAK